jgi:hypothetical protein
MNTSHSDPSRPLREDDAATSAKRPSRPAPDPLAREQRMQYERDILHRNRHVEDQLDHALVESFPASDPLAVTPEGAFPVRDPKLADDAAGEAGQPRATPASDKAPGEGQREDRREDSQEAPRHAGQGPRHAQRRPDPQTPRTPPEDLPPEPIPRGGT